jgi:hypothetical protein
VEGNAVVPQNGPREEQRCERSEDDERSEHLLDHGLWVVRPGVALYECAEVVRVGWSGEADHATSRRGADVVQPTSDILQWTCGEPL